MIQQASVRAIAKEAAGKAAAELVQEGMLVGLGSGSTASFFIQLLGKRCQQGMHIKALASSKESHKQAIALGIPLIEIDHCSQLDLTVDGADEIDPQKRMIKGGGGAFIREKIIASMSREVVVIIDESKQVKRLGDFPLPIEIIPFAYLATIHHLENAGYSGSLRKNDQQTPFITDNGNYIFDIQLSRPTETPEKEEQKIQKIPGVVETGFFFNLAGRIIIGYNDGHVEIRP